MSLSKLRLTVLCALMLLALAARQAPAQAGKCADVIGGVNRVDYNPTKMRIEVAFTKSIKRQDLAGAPANTWVVVDISEAPTDRPLTILGEPVRGGFKLVDASSDAEIPNV